MSFSAEDSRDAAWETRALARSLAPATLRSTERMQRIVSAARGLANETGSAAFTVADIAKGAGLSLKGVYRCFAGKDEILLALLEEESRRGATILAERIALHEEPAARVRAFVDEIFRLLTHPAADGYAGVLLCEQGRLSMECPDELATALAPLVDLLAEQIVATGLFDPDEARRAADTVFGVVLGGIADVTRGRADAHECGAWAWRFCAGGLGLGIEITNDSDPTTRKS